MHALIEDLISVYNFNNENGKEKKKSEWVGDD